MDFRSKGRTWAVNLYGKFEAICQNVDEVVTQDAVHSVGESVKRFYSDIMQDLHPISLVAPAKHGTEAVSVEQDNTMGTYINEMMGTEEDPTYTDIDQSFVEEKAIDAVKNRNEQFIRPPSVDFKEDGCGSPLVLKTDSLVKQKFDAAEENNKMYEQIDKMSNITYQKNDFKEEPSWQEELDLVSPENKDLPEASLFSESINANHGNDMPDEVSPGTSIQHNQKEGRVCNTSLDELGFADSVSNASSLPLSSDMAFSVVSIENKAAEVGLISSSTSLSTETCNLAELVCAENVSQNKESLCNCPIYHIDCVSDLSDTLSSSQQFPMLSCDNKVTDTSLSFCSSVLSLESVDGSPSTTNDAASLTESSESRRENCYACTQLEALLPSLEIDDSTIDISDPSLVSIELSDEVKVDDGCAADGKFLYAVPCRSSRHRSYKQIIKDAFTYKRRLRKEYEQLAILYGDLDIEPSHQPQKNFLPCIHSLLDSEQSSSHDLCGPEWELL